MQLNNAGLKDRTVWEAARVRLPQFDREAMLAASEAAPVWVHFGAGNLFRAPSLQLASFTITEKGYALEDLRGQPAAQAEADFAAGPGKSAHAMGKAAGLLFDRFQAGGEPNAMVSMDNCSHNGERLRQGVLTMAKRWLMQGFVSVEFVDWLENEDRVSFPWSMIDKITPRPAQAVADALSAAGVEGMEIHPDGGAVFVNAEKPQYLVIEDRFPNGRPPLEKAGVYMTRRRRTSGRFCRSSARTASGTKRRRITPWA